MIVDNVFHTMEEYHMIEPGMRVIAGVSGGADSVCLLQMLRQYRREIPFELLVVHVEHGLRGQESLDDAAFVQNLCAKWGIPCRVEKAEVRRRMKEESLTTEEAARAERYRIFEKIGREWPADRIAVAHNRNDQAETVLWNLARGSSLKGLGGIRPVQGKLIRPLLFTDRTEIEAYLQNTGLVWRTDRTNLETEFTRNRIRLSLLPQMEKDLNSQASRHIAEAADRLREVQEYIDRATDEAAARCIAAGEENTDPRRTSSVALRLDAYRKEEHLIRQELLKRAIVLCMDGGPAFERNRAVTGMPDAGRNTGLGKRSGLKDIGAVHIRMLEKLADMDCGKCCDLPGDIRVVRENKILRFERHEVPVKRCEAVALRVPGTVSSARIFDGLFSEMPGMVSVTTELMPNTPELKKYFLEEKKYTKWISYDTIKNNLLLRTRQPGDYLVVNAEGGTKKLKDYLIDQKIPRDMRDRIPLLADGSHILWVIGWRLSEAAKVTDETRLVLKITYTGEKK